MAAIFRICFFFAAAVVVAVAPLTYYEDFSFFWAPKLKNIEEVFDQFNGSFIIHTYFIPLFCVLRRRNGRCAHCIHSDYPHSDSKIFQIWSDSMLRKFASTFDFFKCFFSLSLKLPHSMLKFQNTWWIFHSNLSKIVHRKRCALPRSVYVDIIPFVENSNVGWKKLFIQYSFHQNIYKEEENLKSKKWLVKSNSGCTAAPTDKKENCRDKSEERKSRMKKRFLRCFFYSSTLYLSGNLVNGQRGDTYTIY